ncbi:hypothetical protein BKA58DRAFT_471695 [Alternaria rosae]|uniref:uncharacterized protein n=1 Tax=Alternaria rosae TaxID=1187941 RepID=UPI001E8DB238|nr:uncharacterized protein BKA58DRAFT_471695 [Alternaria rosae]KAH6865758.1 hypothetical protein BKA58DRAFT_471695 [Alternaria rosae]
MYLRTSFFFATFAPTVTSAPYNLSSPTDNIPHSNTTTLVRRADQCASDKHHYPDIPNWKTALSQFCANHGSGPIFSDSAIVFTYNIKGHDGKPIDWIFKVYLDNEDKNYLWSWIPLEQECIDGFTELTKEKGGGLGKSWCYWRPRTSPDDSVGFLGGKWTQDLPSKDVNGVITWESRAKKGQKGL